MRLATAALLAAASLLVCVASAEAARPNVVVIETDDQTAQSLRFMPTLQRLIADQGVTFDNSFVSYSLCCPSRATFLTGQYPHNHGVFDNVLPYGSFYELRGGNTLPVWLRAAGYRTIQLGKYLNGYGSRDPRQVPPGWTDWHALISDFTYHYFGFELNENGRVRYFPPSPANYQTDVLARKAVNLIRRASRGPRPFFMWTAFVAPHFAFDEAPEPDDPPEIRTPVPAPRDRNRFAGEPLPITPAFDERDVRDKPATIRVHPEFGSDEAHAITENYQQELESLQAVDRGVGRIVDALRRAGQLGNTYLVFTSDNGYFHGEHRLPREKILPYEPSIRVPLLVRGPGVPHGVHLSQLASNQDLAPTILDAANAKPGLAQDGTSLLALIRHPRVELGRDLLVEGLYRSLPNVTFSALRSRRWFFAEYSNGERELYDLLADPDELVNRDLDPAYAGIEADLTRRLAGLRRCAGKACLAHPRIEPVLGYQTGIGRGGVTCASSAVQLSLDGPDRGQIDLVDVYANGRRVASGSGGTRTFTIPRAALPRGEVALRPTAYLTDDRAYTTLARVRTCGKRTGFAAQARPAQQLR
ncbi:MAG: N-acetylglucosamine-6-sulfatase [Thermoleophilaceae bacterium]|nr:N-acetylglucosamine-6-sulfatase [Thermoleophilaceae bacterium]